MPYTTYAGMAAPQIAGKGLARRPWELPDDSHRHCGTFSSTHMRSRVLQRGAGPNSHDADVLTIPGNIWCAKGVSGRSDPTLEPSASNGSVPAKLSPPPFRKAALGALESPSFGMSRKCFRVSIGMSGLKPPLS